MSEQLQHESDERENERKQKLLEEVYLEAARSITAMSIKLGASVDADFHNIGKTNEFMNFHTAIATIILVGSDRTLREITTLSSYLSCEILNLMEVSTPVTMTTEEISIHKNILDTHQQKQKYFMKEITNFTVTGNQDQDLWGRLNRQYDFQSEQISNCNEKLDELRKNNFTNITNLAIEVMKVASEFSKLLEPAIISIRSELNLPFDEVAYIELLSKQRQAVEESLENLIKSLENQIEDIK